MTEQVELPGVTPPGRGRQRLDAVLAQLGLDLPRCPDCRRTDYRLEYRDGKRTGWRICRVCGHRWPINPEGGNP